jgi:predicted RNA-binding protein (virulence factor B family)
MDDKRRRLDLKERQAKKKIFQKAKPAENVKRGDMLQGKVYNITEDGAFIQTEENYIGFIHISEQTQPLKNGITVEARVTFVRDDGRVNLSMRPQKENARISDAEKIKEYLIKRKGSMPFNDASPPEIIKEKFGISKAAFKRALGRLFKEGLIEEKEGWITLKSGVVEE